MIITPRLLRLNQPELLAKLALLPNHGELVVTADNLLALKITDDYIHHAYDLLRTPAISKPAYFGLEQLGAHISVIYPSERAGSYEHLLIGQVHSFELVNLIKVEFEQKDYYVVTVAAPALLALRHAYDLPSRLLFKNCRINLHITLAVSNPRLA